MSNPEEKRTCNECKKNNGCWTRGFFLDKFNAWKYCGEFVRGECTYPPAETKREEPKVIDTMISTDSSSILVGGSVYTKKDWQEVLLWQI